MAFTEDLNQFFDTDDFAVDAVFNTTPVPRTVKVIFETPTEEVALYETAVEAHAPFLRCKTSDAVIIKARGATTATIAEVVYQIKKTRNDGTGTSLIFLKT